MGRYSFGSGPGDLDKPSGCDGWTIADVVNHVAGGGHRYVMLLQVRTRLRQL
ncbi:maleylpyruvate isomerase N-terminal domain-containing protein [Mycobacterium seoulense]|uniref:maleylpyruvate isomerase N-terminal domain-containing protein n=1 Tax=Mycobacterium seoulense TaxID=386911 RepID=UPI003CF98320